MSTTRLLPCPLCGSSARMVEMKNGQFFPMCKGQNNFCLLNRYPEEGMDGFIFKIDAVESWNRRAK